MILRRLAEHVRTQNWVAVGLDFVIVVIGVFVGIQLGNLNDARKERGEERQLVLRLIEEAQASASEIERAMAGTVEQADVAARFHDALLSGRVEDEAQFAADLFMMGTFYDEGFVRATLDQAIASGRIRYVRSRQVQDAVADDREDTISSTKGVANAGAMIQDGFTTTYDRIDVRWRPEPALVTPIEDVLADDLFRRRVGQMAGLYGYLQLAHGRTDQINDEYEAVLKAYAREEGWLE